MSKQIAYEDFKTICRICLNNYSVLIPLYGASLDSMLMAIISIKVSIDDQLPDKICKPCCLQISRFYTFKMQCEKNELILRSAYDENLKTEFKNKQMKAALHKKLLDEIKFKKRVMDLANRDNISDQYYENIFMPTTEDEIDISAELTIDQSGNLVTNDLLAETCGVSNSMEFYVFSHKESTKCISSIHNKDDYKDYGCNVNNTMQSEYQPENLEIMNLPHKCSECEERFKTKLNLQTHMLQHIKQVACVTCGKLMSSIALQRHIKTHAAIKPYLCNICDRRFADVGNLAKHRRKHTGELRNAEGKRFLCNICGKAFKWSSSLSKHSKYHTGEKLYTCHFCDRQYVERKSLIIHIRGHTGERPHICLVCNKGFTQQANLEKHKMVHSRERPYSCPICYKSFSQKGYIRVHMRLHTGERPYKCSICPKTFSAKHSLKIHSNQHDGINEIVSMESHEMTLGNPKDGVKMTKTPESEPNTNREEVNLTTIKHTSSVLGINVPPINLNTDNRCTVCDKCFPNSMDLLVHSHEERVNNFALKVDWTI